MGFDIDIDETYLSIYRELLQMMADNPETINGCAPRLQLQKILNALVIMLKILLRIFIHSHRRNLGEKI